MYFFVEYRKRFSFDLNNSFNFTFNCYDMRDAILGLDINYGQLNQLNWTISNYTSGIDDFTNLPDVSTMVIRDKHKYPHIYPFLTNQCNRKELINETDGTLLTDNPSNDSLSVRERIDFDASNFSPKNLFFYPLEKTRGRLFRKKLFVEGERVNQLSCK